MKHLKLFFVCLLMSVISIGQVWAAEAVIYTLDPIIGSDNSYAGAEDIDITDGETTITWNVTGNATMVPWRIGGKKLTGVDRSLYSKTAISANVTKIEITHGTAANVTVNSMSVIVSRNSDFSNPVSTLTPTFAASNTVTVARPNGKDWSNCYFKIVYNVTIGNDNKYIQFSKAKFYSEGGTPQPAVSFAPFLPDPIGSIPILSRAILASSYTLYILCIYPVILKSSIFIHFAL